MVADAYLFASKVKEGEDSDDVVDGSAPTLALKVIMHFTKNRQGKIVWKTALMNPRGQSVPLLYLAKRVLGMDAMGVPWLKLSNFCKFTLFFFVSYDDCI